MEIYEKNLQIIPNINIFNHNIDTLFSKLKINNNSNTRIYKPLYNKAIPIKFYNLHNHKFNTKLQPCKTYIQNNKKTSKFIYLTNKHDQRFPRWS